MTDRISKIDVGTIGSKPCEISLNRILIRIDDAKITGIIMKRYHDLKIGLNKLKVLDRSFSRRMMLMFYHQIRDSFIKRSGDVPEDAFTYSLCCFKALYREALRETGAKIAHPKHTTCRNTELCA